MSPVQRWVYDDGGRADAGYAGRPAVGDCAVRGVAIATGLGYQEVRDLFDRIAKSWAAEQPDLLHNICKYGDYGVAGGIAARLLTALGWRRSHWEEAPAAV